MTKKEIMDNYAKEQGYEDWIDLQSDHYGTSSQIQHHWEAIIDLIQVELKERIKESYCKDYHAEFDTLIDILVPLVE